MYTQYLQGIWERGHLTNHGPLVTELEEKLKKYLGVNHFYYLNNGTIAIQIAIKALELTGDIITTPFSYVATCSSIVWENARPVFVDIDPDTFTIDSTKIEAALTPATSAILATHVYGIPCAVEAIEAIARKHGLKVVYDAAHAFGVHYKGRPLLTYGDISTLSFHATKLFHTVEGGGITANNPDIAHRIAYLRNFGHNGQEAFWGLGINGKSSEFHAAMGLCVFPSIEALIQAREERSRYYDSCLNEFGIRLKRPLIPEGTTYNYAYYPVVFASEEELIAVRDALNAEQVFPRRYFFPSLHHLPYIREQYELPVTEAISKAVLCLPFYHDLPFEDIRRICSVIAKTIKAR